jgi:hypothetical protein
MAVGKPVTGVSAFPPKTLWEGFVRGARPAGVWVCVMILAVRGAVLPLLQFFTGRPVEPLDWMGVVSLAVPVLGLSALRSFDKKEGTA